jgi:uncharacterized protein (TIGR03086 family)
MRFDDNDTVRMYLKTMNWVGDLLSAVLESSLATSTPCTDFDVRSLSGHLIGTAERSLGTAERRSTREIPHVIIDVPDTMLAQRFGELAEQIHSAWSVLEPGEPVVAPWGQCSALDAVRGFTIETLVHGWDLAVATDQPSEAPAGLADAVNVHVDRVIPETTRNRMYAPAWPSADDAGPTEQLANSLGHHRRT